MATRRTKEPALVAAEVAQVVELEVSENAPPEAEQIAQAASGPHDATDVEATKVVPVVVDEAPSEVLEEPVSFYAERAAAVIPVGRGFRYDF